MYLQGIWSDGKGGNKQSIIESDSWAVCQKLENMYKDDGFTLQNVRHCYH